MRQAASHKVGGYQRLAGRENRIRIIGPAKEGPIKFLTPMVTPGRSAVLRAADQRRQFLVPVVVGGQQVRLVWADNPLAAG
jgi:hypothetical protein